LLYGGLLLEFKAKKTTSAVDWWRASLKLMRTKVTSFAILMSVLALE